MKRSKEHFMFTYIPGSEVLTIFGQKVTRNAPADTMFSELSRIDIFNKHKLKMLCLLHAHPAKAMMISVAGFFDLFVGGVFTADELSQGWVLSHGNEQRVIFPIWSFNDMFQNAELVFPDAFRDGIWLQMQVVPGNTMPILVDAIEKP
ncbi:MAG: hypothetical protein ACOCXQ_05135 [Patescibacteria group bacterium]